jgi:hypothetical protein
MQRPIYSSTQTYNILSFWKSTCAKQEVLPNLRRIYTTAFCKANLYKSTSIASVFPPLVLQFHIRMQLAESSKLLSKSNSPFSPGNKRGTRAAAPPHSFDAPVAYSAT